jgi:hypothetical protein
VTDMASRLGLELASATRAWLDEAMRQGPADLDYSAVVRTIAGRQREEVVARR